jgi:hypothetical protein
MSRFLPVLIIGSVFGLLFYSDRADPSCWDAQMESYVDCPE